MRVDLRPGCQLRAYTHYSIKCSRLSLFLHEYCREVNVKEYVCVQEMFKIYFSSLHIQNWTTIDLRVSVFISNVHLFAAGPSTPSFCSIFLLLDTNYVQERSEVLGGFVPFTGEWTYTHTAISPGLSGHWLKQRLVAALNAVNYDHAKGPFLSNTDTFSSFNLELCNFKSVFKP